jgi:hypothetical protein
MSASRYHDEPDNNLSGDYSQDGKNELIERHYETSS